MPELYPIAVGQPLSLGAAAPEPPDLMRLSIQPARRDRHHEAVLPRSVQANPLPYLCVRLLRRAGHARRQAAALLHPHRWSSDFARRAVDRQISELPYQWWWSSNLAPAHSNKLRRLFIPECPVLTLDVPTEKETGLLLRSSVQVDLRSEEVGREAPEPSPRQRHPVRLVPSAAPGPSGPPPGSVSAPRHRAAGQGGRPDRSVAPQPGPMRIYSLSSRHHEWQERREGDEDCQCEAGASDVRGNGRIGYISGRHVRTSRGLGVKGRLRGDLEVPRLARLFSSCGRPWSVSFIGGREHARNRRSSSRSGVHQPGSPTVCAVRRQRSLDRPGGLNKGKHHRPKRVIRVANRKRDVSLAREGKTISLDMRHDNFLIQHDALLCFSATGEYRTGKGPAAAKLTEPPASLGPKGLDYP